MTDLENNSVSTNPQDFNHTPTPWKARDYPNKEGDYWIDCDSWEHKGRGGCRGGTLATAHDNGAGPEGNAKANALRITSAVNACEGISNEALDSNVIKDLVRALKLQMPWTMRDGTPCNCPAGENEGDFDQPKKMPTVHASHCEDARAALAKLKSGQLPQRKLAKGDRVILSRVRHSEYKGQVGEIVKIIKSRNQVSVRLESGVLYDASPENIDRHPS